MSALAVGGGLALIAVVVFVVPMACDAPTCKTGTITARVYMSPPINLDADRVVITSIDPPDVELQATATGTLSDANGVSVELAFPHGYVAEATITLHGQAFAGPVLLGDGLATIHTGAKCSDATLYILPLSKSPPPTDPDAGM